MRLDYKMDEAKHCTVMSLLEIFMNLREIRTNKDHVRTVVAYIFTVNTDPGVIQIRRY